MRFVFILLTVCLLVGCGYHFPGSSGALPGNVEKIYVPLFKNKTSEPRLEVGLADRISQVSSRSAQVSLVEQRESAEAVLDGDIVGYSSIATAYDSNDDISEYKATMVVEARLVDARSERGDVLWHKTIRWSRDYTANDNKAVQENFEDDAIDELQMRIAEELFNQLLSDF